MLAARAHEEGHAQRTSMYRHRALAKNPLCIVAWQLGAEPYSVGAIAAGTKSRGYTLYVPGYPLNRELLFAELTRFAKQFCAAFEKYTKGPCEVVQHFGEDLHVPTELPQIVVANAETIGLLGRLGRRLAYLPTDGEHPADPVLPRMGRHLLWLADRAQMPGQQLVLSVTDLLTTHYATAMSGYEIRSLAAIDAWIAPPRGKHGFHAAEASERQAVGPTPDPKDGEKIHQAMGQFNTRRAGSHDPAIVQKLIGPMCTLYDGMVRDTWDLTWRALDRERLRDEAPSVARRSTEDRIAYANHMNWMNGPAEGRRRTRMSSRAAAMRLNEYERARAKLEAEEAIDDPLRMVPVLLAGKAIAGMVTGSDPNRRERVNSRNCLRPIVTIRTLEPCTMPVGTEVWWIESPRGREWLISSVTASDTGSVVTLVLQTNRTQAAGLPRIGRRACFSELNTHDSYEVHLPQQVPWTHRSTEPAANETHLEGGAEGAEAA